MANVGSGCCCSPATDGAVGSGRYLRGGPNAAVREALTRADPDQEDINVVESYEPFKDSDKLGKRLT